MRAINSIALLAGLALVGTGCGPGASPNRAVPAGGTTVVLTMANPLGDAEALTDFVKQVDALTGGSVRIDVQSGWRAGEIDFETGLIADVKAGKADLGVAGSRAFDSAGVLSLRALHAPLLITSYAAEEQVLKSPVVSEMLGGLASAGLAGIGILPGDLRRPLGVAGPLRKPADYAGRTIGTQQSVVADETMRALGAKPVRFPVTGKIDGFDGIEQQIASIQGNRYDKVGKYLTANVAWWPRPFVLFAGSKALARLDGAQRQAVQRAATAALPDSMARVLAGEQESLGNLCRAQLLRVAPATPGDLAALRKAVQPVYDALERDPQTKLAIATITSTVQGVTPEPAPACAQPGQTSAAGKTLDGVYTMTTKFGDNPSDTDVVPENYGSWILVLRDGHFAITQEYQNACTWGYGTFALKGAQLEVTFVDGGGISPNNAMNKPGEFFTFGWSVYRDTLTLTPVESAISPENFRVKPWHRSSTTPSAKYLNKKCPPPASALG
jgi:TRAP-type C4-dicarboxylate transport system substrate-binding protein